LSSALKAGVLWDATKQLHLGEKKSLRDIINKYEIDDYTVAKVKAIYSAYRYLEIEVDPGYELQAKVDMTYDIILPPSQFVPSITVGDNHAKEVVNLWKEANKQSEDDRKWIFPLKITGFYDRKYSTYFAEDKLSGRPSFYLDPFALQSQCGTYLLADPNLEYFIMEVVQFPQHKELKKGESPSQMYERVLSDILSRPSKFFMGFDKEKRKYGVKFFRGEICLDEIEKSYQQIVIELLSARWSNNWYKNRKACNNMYGRQCEFMTVCSTNTVSDTMYKIREK
ncbi:MAG: hypothetical protein WC373_15410, partial [Smithella sp.]